MIRKVMTLILFITLLWVSVSLSVSNHQTDLTLRLFPLPGPGWTFPVYAWVFGLFLFGLFLGYLLCRLFSDDKKGELRAALVKARSAEMALARYKAQETENDEDDLSRALAKLPS